MAQTEEQKKLAERMARKEPDDPWDGVIRSVVGSISGFVAMGFAYGVGAVLDWYHGLVIDIRWDTSNVGHGLISVLVGGSCILLGRLLFELRAKRRGMYAYMELCSAFGFALEAFSRFSSKTETLPVIAALMGAVYVAVRGFDNLDQHRNPKKK